MSSGFITESEAVEVRKRRQEEWEKVRKADDPLERPEEKFDHRSLFERLQEQKQKKDLEYEEAHKLKNMIKGLDDDEIEFLDLVDRTKLAADRKKTIEEELELHDYRNRVATLQEKTLDKKLQVEGQSVKPKVIGNNRISQVKLLKGVVVKKNENRKRKLSDMEEPNPKSEKTDNKETEDQKTQGDQNKQEENKDEEVAGSLPSDRMQCIGILPGLGYYGDSSSDEVSSDSDDSISIKEQCDILGRKLTIPKKNQVQTPSQQN